ncbi:MAG TPA: peptidoglycan editing factor PgeF [Steroidobacteraceae bacterium]|jgi:YfiH family protein|nr:peptidoglycan editing factor PgeF [Steroidobacteraceae bacterium]
MHALRPDWPVAGRVRAVFTLRAGGVSTGHCASLNIGAQVQDDPAAVAENRRRLITAFDLPAEPTWLTQVHGAAVSRLEPRHEPSLNADAVVTAATGRVCVIQVADCLPVLFAARDGSVIGAAHAGWRGLAAGVLENTLTQLGVRPAQLLAWIGPGIGPAHFEVGAEVRDALIESAPKNGTGQAADAFQPNARGRWQCDLVALIRQRLAAAGLIGIHGGNWCTFADAERFFSHRRDGRSGRMAALIWLV